MSELGTTLSLPTPWRSSNLLASSSAPLMDISTVAGAVGALVPSISPSIGSKLLQQLSSERLDDAHASMIIALLARASPADVTNARGGYGRPLTHVLLSQHDRPDLIDALLAARADVGATDNDGRTALHWAASAGRLQCAITLLSHDADSTRRDEERLSPLDLARREHHSDLVALLEGKPVPPRPVIRVIHSV